ncbi:benzylsuccinate synthase activating enzyme [bacterium BMS3Bbin01]|nr:benzylsuccinate synthase activating enzyme [bacterium BMS3Bbin01]
MTEPTAPVFDVQRFSLHDGPGIRSLVFLKGCTLHCPWCQNPESQEAKPVIAFYEDRCEESFECAVVCPNGSIRFEGFRVDHARCDQCALCVDACAYGALRLIGENLTPRQLIARLLADRPYYESSGGGVTFTGGEPTLHHRFVERVLELCREAGIHTNLETAGTFSWARWEQTLRLLDLIYFDLKILDSELHERHLGGGFARIMENAAKLVAHRFPVEFRMALIPGFTDTPVNIEAVVGLLRGLGQEAIHLLAYHNMGEAKIDIIQGRQPKLGLERYSDERWLEMSRAFELRGIEVLGEAQPDSG